MLCTLSYFFARLIFQRKSQGIVSNVAPALLAWSTCKNLKVITDQCGAFVSHIIPKDS